VLGLGLDRKKGRLKNRVQFVNLNAPKAGLYPIGGKENIIINIIIFVVVVTSYNLLILYY
jgi:hypothetical protein